MDPQILGRFDAGSMTCVFCRHCSQVSWVEGVDLQSSPYSSAHVASQQYVRKRLVEL